MRVKLVIIDTTHIQDYVFGSNRLRENLGASYLVSQATREWVAACLPHNPDVNVLEAQIPLEDGAAAEIVYLGGGNALLWFNAATSAYQAFIHDYSRKLLCEAPGLEVVIADVEFDWTPGGALVLPTHIKQLMQEQLPRAKQMRQRHQPILGLGVTVACQSTGLPAVDMSPPIPATPGTARYPVSAETYAKLEVVTPMTQNGKDKATERLEHYLEQGSDIDFSAAGYVLPYDLDNLGRSKGEHSYIAVVHADGDGIGNWFATEVGKEAQYDREYIAHYRQASQDVQRVAQLAMQATVHSLLSDANVKISDKGTPTIKQTNVDGEPIASIEFQQRLDRQGKPTGAFYLPFRPIVFGGDDITFVCDGRLALALTTMLLKEFEKQAQNILKSALPITASAGVAIVKSHYPFSRAYDLAEELTASAKRYRHYLINALDKVNQPRYGVAGYVGCIDWHFALGGLLGDLDTIRRQHYHTSHGSLTLRPVVNDVVIGRRNPHLAFRTWETIEQMALNFQDDEEVRGKNNEPQWSTRRNKVKALRDALRHGPDAVHKFVTAYRIHPEAGSKAPLLPALQHGNSADFQTSGWAGGYCAYFDAVEILDWYVPLTEVEHVHA